MKYMNEYKECSKGNKMEISKETKMKTLLRPVKHVGMKIEKEN